MNKEQKLRDIKFSLISPIESLFLIFDYDKDDDVLPLWMTEEPGQAISDILNIKESEPYIDKVISEYGLEEILEKFITPEDPTLNDLILDSDKILLFVDISNMIKEDMRKLRIKMCKELTKDKPGYNGKINFNKFWKELRPMSNELIDCVVGYINDSFYDIDNDLAYEFANTICQSIQDVCDGLNGNYNNLNETKENNEMKDIIKELRSEVNNMDKDFDVDLKNPSYMADTKKKYLKLLNIIKAVIVVMIVNINGISRKHIKRKNKRYLFRDINEKVITEESIIFNNKDYYDDTKVSRFRYFTLLLIYIFNNLENIAHNSYLLADEQKKFIEYEFKSDFIKAVFFKLIDMLEKINKNENISEEKMYFTNLMIYKKSLDKDDYDKGVDKINKIRKQNEALLLNMKKHPRKNQDILMDTILKLSQLVSTNKTKVTKNIIPENNYKFRNKKLNREYLISLGKKVIDKGPGKGLKMYIKTNPIIYSHFKDVNDNEALRVGILAMNYYKFLAENNKLKKRVNKIS